MAAAALVSVAEYLKTSYRPDQELLEGQLVERNGGEYDHSNLQGVLVGWLFQHQQEWNIRVLPEQRLRVSATRFRIPDVCVIVRGHAVEAVLTQPPLICMEVLSKDDTLRSMQERVDDYRALGVPNIWVFDPVKRRAYICQAGDFRQSDDVLEVPSTPIRISLADLFAFLD